jgi:hypothetical protein
MLKTLQTTDIIEALLSVKNAVASTVLTDSIVRCLNSIQTTGKVLRSDDTETIELREIIANYSEHVLVESAFELYKKTPIFCHDEPVCNAIARQTLEGVPFVIIYSGLLNVCTYRLCLSIIIHNVQLMLNSRYTDIETANKHLKTLAFNAMAISYWYYISGFPNPLPQFFDILNYEHKLQVFHGLGGALTFIIMHEIGHIELGHTRGNSNAIPQIYSTIEIEEKSLWKT